MPTRLNSPLSKTALLFSFLEARIVAAMQHAASFSIDQGGRGRSSLRNSSGSLAIFTACWDEFSWSLFANSNRRVSPHAPIPVPYRFSTRPIAVRRGSHIDRWRRIVAWGSGCGPDNRSYGKPTYEPRAQISAACTSWESRGTCQR
jgi:hypothetical protein